MCRKDIIATTIILISFILLCKCTYACLYIALFNPNTRIVNVKKILQNILNGHVSSGTTLQTGSTDLGQ